MKKPFNNNVRWIKDDGTPTDYFRDLVQNLSQNGLTERVSAVSPTNGQVLVFNSTTGLYTPGAN